MTDGATVRWCVGAMVLGALAVSPSIAQQRPVTGLTGAAQLARVYTAIFDGRFDEVPALVAQACPPAPVEACRVVEALALWWRIQVDPNNTANDPALAARADAAIAATEAWTVREPRRAEAWFYLGGAYGVRVQWRVLRGERLAAARDGKRIKDSLERALQLDPAMQDAYFGIGLYHYYADVAPTAAKVLRWLLLLPGGDRAQGMQEMLRARGGGQLLRSEADYQLHILYLWYEKQPERALELLADLQQRHPRNPHFRQLTAEVEDVYLHDTTASLRSWRALLAAAREGQVTDPSMAAAAARLGAALQLDRLFESDAAVEHLRAVIAAKPAAPFGALAQAQLQLGHALDRLGYRSEAVAAYRAAIAATAPSDPLKIAEQARTGIRTAPRPQDANAYRLSIEGWRKFERGAVDEAARTIAESLALAPHSPVTRYRQTRILQAQKNDAAALTILEAIVLQRNTTPPTIYASACLDAGRMHEALGSRARAIELYETARSVFGADKVTKDAAERALTRLTTSARVR